MLSWEWTRDTFEPCSSLPLSDRGFRYGMSIFESLRLENGSIHFAQNHWNRLVSAASQCRFPIPPPSALSRTQSLLKSTSSTCFIRWYWTAGDGSPSSPAIHPRLFLLAEPRTRSITPTPSKLSLHPLPVIPAFGGLKTGNYWANLEALAHARNQDFDECLLNNPDGNVIGAAMANVFLKIEGQWITPPLTTGARNGVVREWILQHLPVKEASLHNTQLEKVEGLFLSNSWIGIQPVYSLQNRSLAPTPEIDQLQSRFENQTH